MRIFRTIDELVADGRGAPVVVIASPTDADLIECVQQRFDLRAELSGLLRRHTRIRPLVHVQGEQCLLQVVVVDPNASFAVLRICATPAGLLVVTDQPGAVVEPLVTAVARTDDVGTAVVAILAEAGRTSEDHLEEFARRARESDGFAAGYLSRRQRTTVLDTRSQLLAISDVFAAQQRLTSDVAQLAQLYADAAGLLQVASRRFTTVADLSGRFYSLLGDTLSQQSAIVTERLTLVNTIFLPLTLSTSFFGMNLGWMTDRIGTFGAFLAFGIGMPILLSAVTFLVIRGLVR